MKKIIIAIALLSTQLNFAQTEAVKKDTSYWKTAGFLGLNLSSTTLSDWAAGGQDNISVTSIFNYQADYKKDKHAWSNKFDGQLGYIKPGSASFRKNVDQILAISKYNINAFSKYWFYMAQADYRTQFAPSYAYVNNLKTQPATADFTSPSYLQLAIGLDCKPVDYFSASFAPLAGKITTVNRQYLADAGAFGVDKAVVDATTGKIITPGKKMRMEFGGRLIFKFKKDIAKGINWDSYLDLFSNYINHPENVDVVFNNLITIRLSKYLSASVSCQMLYDNDVIRKRDLNADGKYDQQGEINGPRLQVSTTIGVGFGYKF